MQETSAAFVTLHQRQLQSTVAIGMMSYDESLWQTQPAPSPNEIIWHNVQWRGWERGLRGILGWGVLVTLIICFVPIVTFLQQLVALDAYAQKPGVLGKIAKAIIDIPFVGGAHRPY